MTDPYEMATAALGACIKAPSCDHATCVMPRYIVAVYRVVEAAKKQAETREIYDYDHPRMRSAVTNTNWEVRTHLKGLE